MCDLDITFTHTHMLNSSLPVRADIPGHNYSVPAMGERELKGKIHLGNAIFLQETFELVEIL